MAATLEFTKQGEDYISNSIQLTTGSIAIQLSFADNVSKLILSQSVNDETFVAKQVWNYIPKDFYINASKGIKGQYIRLSCSSMPVKAEYLQEEE